jgi:ATP phosphoribosyltransferase
MSEPLTLALPKGRLFEQVQEHFAQRGVPFHFEKRKLVAEDEQGLLRILLVKNSDLPTYVQHGIAGLGVCGEDVVYETGYKFAHIHQFDFGGTRICLAGTPESRDLVGQGPMTIATKFTEFTKDFYQKRQTPVKVIKLNGSVELAPVLGLAPFIVDLVETGSTLKANGLEVIQELAQIKVHLLANPSYLKLHFSRIKEIVAILKK